MSHMDDRAMFLTVEEVAAELRVPKTTVYTWLQTGKLKAVKAGKLWRIRRGDVDDFLNGEGQE